MPADIVPFPAQNIVRDKAEQRRVTQAYAAGLRRKGATPEIAWEAASQVAALQAESAVHRAIRIAREDCHD